MLSYSFVRKMNAFLISNPIKIKKIIKTNVSYSSIWNFDYLNAENTSDISPKSVGHRRFCTSDNSLRLIFPFAWLSEQSQETEFLVLAMTRLLPKLRHDRFIPRMPIRKFAGKRSSQGMSPSKGCLFKRSCSRWWIPLLRLTVWPGALTWSDHGPKCYAGIQPVNQSGKLAE